MPRRELTQDQIDAFRAKAVDAATSMFATHGVDGVSMRRLAAAIGCSAMTPYRYFADRDELFAMVRADAFRRFAEDQRAAFHAHAEPLERIGALREAYVAFALREPDAYRIMFELAQRPAGHYPRLVQESRRAFGFLQEAVSTAITTGALTGDPDTVAHLLWASVHGIVSLHLAGKLEMGPTLPQLSAQLHQLYPLPRSSTPCA